MRLRSKLIPVIEICLFLVLIIINATPIAWGVLSSLKLNKDILAFPPKIIGFTPTLEHYTRIISSGFFQSLLTSVFYSAACIVFGVLLSLFAAYGFDRYHFRFRNALFLLVVMGIPLSMGSGALLIPNYLYMASFGLTNRWYTLVLLYTTYNLPMAIWILKGALEAVPKEIDEAATIDGCTGLSILFRILLPLSKPAIAAASIFLFIGSWNEFIAASVMVDSPVLRPVQLTIYHYLGFFGREWGPLTAAASLAVVPILIAFAFLSRLLVSGLTQGSTKG